VLPLPRSGGLSWWLQLRKLAVLLPVLRSVLLHDRNGYRRENLLEREM
jgi:hypothetical protein